MRSVIGLYRGFPFSGQTTLHFEGRSSTFKHNGQVATRYFISRLLYCTHPLPFREADYVLKLYPDRAERVDEELEPIRVSPKPRYKARAEAIHNADTNFPAEPTEPSKLVDLLKIQSPQNRFADFEGKEIKKLLKTVQTHQYEPGPSLDVPHLNGVSTGEGTFGMATQVRGEISTKQSSRNALSRDLVTFLAVVQLIRCKVVEGVQVETLSLHGAEDRHGVANDAVIPLSSVGYGFWTRMGTRRGLTWTFLGGGSNPRRVALVQIQFGEEYMYLMELERCHARGREDYSVLTFARADRKALPQQTFEFLLERTVANSGWPSKEEQRDRFQEMRFVPVTHQGIAEAEKLATRILMKSVKTLLPSAVAPAVT